MDLQTMFDLTGRTALVTGSSRGIGKAIAFALGRAGAVVTFHASAPSEVLDATLSEARSLGIRCDAVTVNLSCPEAVASFASRMTSPDILVLNASVQKYMTVESFDGSEFEREMNTNLRSGYLLVQAVLPAMREKGFGRILSVGSVNQWKQAPRLTLYAASKCAQTAMILSLARSHAAFGITANNIAPGVIATDRNREALADTETVAKLLDQIPIRRFGTPNDLAGIALLLASSAGDYINGADIPVTGGMHL